MTTLNYSALRKKAAEEGSGGDIETLPVGEYDGEIVGAGAKAKSDGFGLWWRFKVLTGPEAGKQTFLNQQLKPENGASLDIFFRVAKDLGIDFDAIPDGTPPGDWVKLVVGSKYHFEIVHNPSKTDPSRVFANFRNIKRLDASVVPAPQSTPPLTPVRNDDIPGAKLPF